MAKHVKVLLITLSIALNVAFVGVWVTRAISAPRGAPRPYPGPQPDQPIWCPLHRELNVSPEQWQRIEPRLEEFRSQMDSITAEVQGLRLEVVDLLARPQSDGETVEAKQEEILTAQRRMQRLVAEHLLEEKKVLTPDQQRQLFETIRGRLSGTQSAGPLLVPGKAAEGGIGKILRDSGRGDTNRHAEDTPDS
jgi:Spy/CpxP family protein refolding chaperone